VDKDNFSLLIQFNPGTIIDVSCEGMLGIGSSLRMTDKMVTSHY